MPPPPPPTVLVPSERAVVLLSCVLSAVGSGLLITTHALWPDLRSLARRLLLFLSLADLLSAASYFYGVLQDFEDSSWDCVLQGALSTFANTSSFFWTVAIALYLYLCIVRTACGPETGRLLWAFHVVRWREELSEYRPIVSEVHRLQRHTSVADKKLVLIPLIFICLRVWSTVRFVLTLCGSPAVRMPVLVVLHGIGNTFQGGANCIMFVFCTRAVRTRLLSLCCCCTPQPPTAESLAGPPKALAPSKSESQRPRRTPNELPST
ncbi:hypothetical protein FD754_019954 [Muntiacus muntjak]|uniref:G-protein coupled receptors family 2 profile 2 domain-containing protein n=1 Tax=Muntiacus muntjak TaxID=9888 RepID=A0A5N3V238_MUNMU|nr:hypothetical protein FD754_019954 [Muntiacus muntjak]